MTGAEESLRDRIAAAFAGVTPPPADRMLLDAFAGSHDAEEMAAAFRGRSWTDLSIDELFRHREMVVALGPAAYRAYLPAYLTATLTDDARRGPDLREYLLFGLRPLSDEGFDVATTRERLSLLDRAQRDAVAAVLRYLVDERHVEEAVDVLREWEPPAG